jgi:hypothetical protein
MSLTFEDCIGLCDLSEAEVLAIAEHEQIPAMTAVELGNYLVHTTQGEQRIKDMIREDIAAAIEGGDRPKALALKSIIRDYIVKHPCCEARRRDALCAAERRSTAIP